MFGCKPREKVSTSYLSYSMVALRLTLPPSTLPEEEARKREEQPRTQSSRGSVNQLFFVGSCDPTGNAVHYATEVYVLTPYAKK